MLKTHFCIHDRDIDIRLSEFEVTREELINVVREVVGARADSVEDDPSSGAGLFAYIHGTRNVRALWRSRGWLIDRQDNIESVKHPERRLKIVYQSVDIACNEWCVPQAISGKGSGTERAIHSGQAALLFLEELDVLNHKPVSAPPSGLWFFCVSVNGDDVCAELSKASEVSGGNFHQFEERIFVVRPGEWEKVRVVGGADSDGIEFEPVIRRK